LCPRWPIRAGQTTRRTAPPVPHGTLAQRMQSLLGLVCFTLLAFAIAGCAGIASLSPRELLVWGMLLQFAFGGIVVFNRTFLIIINDAIDALLGFTRQGATMVFGDLVWNNITSHPRQLSSMDPVTPSAISRTSAPTSPSSSSTIIFSQASRPCFYHIGSCSTLCRGWRGSCPIDEDQRR